MKKNYNTQEYRNSKRVVGFVKPQMKEKLLKLHKKTGISVSKLVGEALEMTYGGK